MCNGNCGASNTNVAPIELIPMTNCASHLVAVLFLATQLGEVSRRLVSTRPVRRTS